MKVGKWSQIQCLHLVDTPDVKVPTSVSWGRYVLRVGGCVGVGVVQLGVDVYTMHVLVTFACAAHPASPTLAALSLSVFAARVIWLCANHIKAIL